MGCLEGYKETVQLINFGKVKMSMLVFYVCKKGQKYVFFGMLKDLPFLVVKSVNALFRQPYTDLGICMYKSTHTRARVFRIHIHSSALHPYIDTYIHALICPSTHASINRSTHSWLRRCRRLYILPFKETSADPLLWRLPTYNKNRGKQA